MSDLYLNKDQYKTAASSVWGLVEELYQSGNAINEERIYKYVNDLCEIFGIEEEELDLGLQVKHWKDKR